jgi:hypothetical protein
MRPSDPIPQDPSARAAGSRPRRRRRDHPTRTSGRGDRARHHASTSSSVVSEPPAPRGSGRRVHWAHLPVIAALAAGALVLGASHAHAETTQFVALAASVDQVLTNIRNWIMGILASLATVFVSVGGVRYVMAGGDPSGHCCVRDGEQRLSCLTHENRSLCHPLGRALGVRRVSVSAGGDHLGGALVSAVRALLP